MQRPLRILYIEDMPDDVELTTLALADEGIRPEIRQVWSRDALLAELGRFDPEIVLSDYRMPGFDGLEALLLVRQRLPEVPFIFFSGGIGEDRAIEALKQGASDYVLKDHPKRLVPSIRRALEDAEKRAAHKRLEEQYLQAQKMEAIGRLAGGIAHDFNNLLTVILGGCRMLSKAPCGDAQREDLLGIEEAAQRAVALTRQLLLFSRRQTAAPRLIGLGETLRRLKPMLERLIGEDIAMSVETAEGDALVLADPNQVEQAVMNLVVNARDAMPKGGTLKLATALGAGGGDLPPGDYVALAVTDSGSGMDAETQSHLFEPFFTTKERGKGTGLGLPTVHGIVTQAGGFVRVRSAPGQGTTFTLYFPARAGQAEPPPSERLDARGGNETLLLVEDDAAVRRVLRRTLEGAGYRVLEAADGERGLAAFEAGSAEIRAVVSDVVMPNLGGLPMARRLWEKAPKLPVVFLSGYPEEDGREELRELAGRALFLEKPAPRERLLAAVRSALDRAAARP